MTNYKPSRRFTWDKPIVAPEPIQPDHTEHRLKKNKAVRPSPHSIQAEYDSIKQKRKGHS